MWLPEGHFAHHVSDLGLGLDGVLRAKGTVGATRRMRDGQGAVVRVRGCFRREGGSWKRTRRFGCWGRETAAARCASFAVGTWRMDCSWRWWRAGLARFGKLSIDGTKVRANASKRKSYGARGGAALEGGGVAEHGGGRTLWGAVARGRVARRVAPSRGPAGGGGEGACGATRGARGRRPEWERHPKGGQPSR